MRNKFLSLIIKNPTASLAISSYSMFAMVSLPLILFLDLFVFGRILVVFMPILALLSLYLSNKLLMKIESGYFHKKDEC